MSLQSIFQNKFSFPMLPARLVKMFLETSNETKIVFFIIYLFFLRSFGLINNKTKPTVKIHQI